MIQQVPGLAQLAQTPQSIIHPLTRLVTHPVTLTAMTYQGMLTAAVAAMAEATSEAAGIAAD